VVCVLTVVAVGLLGLGSTAGASGPMGKDGASDGCGHQRIDELLVVE
jgi:hypothetical protein